MLSANWCGMRMALVVGLFGALVSGCIGGPCVHTYEEDVLHLETVSDAMTGAALAEVVITEARRGGVAMTSLSGEGLVPMGGGAARCTLPCSLGTVLEGDYEIDVSADGYEATTIAVSARYATLEGGCPSRNDGGTRVSAMLDPM